MCYVLENRADYKIVDWHADARGKFLNASSILCCIKVEKIYKILLTAVEFYSKKVSKPLRYLFAIDPRGEKL